MINVLIEKSETVQEELHVETRKDYKELKKNIKKQRDENEIVYKGLKEVIKDTDAQRSKIAIYTAKIEELEQHVGLVKDNENLMADDELFSPDEQEQQHLPGQQFEDNSSLKEVTVKEESKSTREIEKVTSNLTVKTPVDF